MTFSKKYTDVATNQTASISVQKKKNIKVVVSDLSFFWCREKVNILPTKLHITASSHCMLLLSPTHKKEDNAYSFQTHRLILLPNNHRKDTQ